MTRALLIAAGLTLTASAAQAQCLALSDGFGSTTVSCPDGRSGLLRTDPGGMVSGMIGGQPFSGTTAGIDAAGSPAGAPSASYLVAPPPPALNAPPPEPTSPAALGPLAPQVELTQLQQQYLDEQRSLRLRQAEAARRKGAEKPPSPAAAPGRSTRPAGSGPLGGSPG